MIQTRLQTRDDHAFSQTNSEGKVWSLLEINALRENFSFQESQSLCIYRAKILYNELLTTVNRLAEHPSLPYLAYLNPRSLLHRSNPEKLFKDEISLNQSYSGLSEIRRHIEKEEISGFVDMFTDERFCSAAIAEEIKNFYNHFIEPHLYWLQEQEEAEEYARKATNKSVSKSLPLEELSTPKITTLTPVIIVPAIDDQVFRHKPFSEGISFRSPGLVYCNKQGFHDFTPLTSLLRLHDIQTVGSDDSPLFHRYDYRKASIRFNDSFHFDGFSLMNLPTPYCGGRWIAVSLSAPLQNGYRHFALPTSGTPAEIVFIHHDQNGAIYPVAPAGNSKLTIRTASTGGGIILGAHCSSNATGVAILILDLDRERKLNLASCLTWRSLYELCQPKDDFVLARNTEETIIDLNPSDPLNNKDFEVLVRRYLERTLTTMAPPRQKKPVCIDSPELHKKLQSFGFNRFSVIAKSGVLHPTDRAMLIALILGKAKLAPVIPKQWEVSKKSVFIPSDEEIQVTSSNGSTCDLTVGDFFQSPSFQFQASSYMSKIPQQG